jgi:hypothetical protein
LCLSSTLQLTITKLNLNTGTANAPNAVILFLVFKSDFSIILNVPSSISWCIPFSRFLLFVDIAYLQIPQSLGTGWFSLFKPLYFPAIIIIIITIIVGGGGGGVGGNSSSSYISVPFLSDLSWFADVIL